MAEHNVRVNVNTSADTSAVDKLNKSLASVQKQIDVLVSHTGLLKSNNELLAQSWAELDTKTRWLQTDLSNLSKGTQEYTVKNKALDDTIKLQNETYVALRKNRTEIASNERMINALQKEVWTHESITNEITKENSSIKWWTISREAYIKWVEEWTKKSHEAREALLKLRQSQNASDEEIKKAQNNLLIARRNLKEYKQWLKESTDQLWFFGSSLVKVNKKLKEQFALAAAKKLLTMARQLFSYVSHQIIEQWLALDKVKDQFSILTKRVWENAIEMRNAMRTASLWLVADTDLMASANKALELWVVKSADDMATLMKIATVRGREMWEEVTKAFDDIVVWLWRMSPRILDNLWIIVSEADAYEKYAQKVGKTSKELSKAEKQQAMFDAVVQASQVQLEQWGQTSLSIADKIKILEVKAKNSFATVWAAFLQWFEPMIDYAMKELDNLTSSIDDWTQLINWSWTWLWDNIVTSLESIKTSFWNARTNIKDAVSGVVNTLWNTLWALFNWINGWSYDSSSNMQRVFLYSLNSIWRMVESLSIAFNTLWDIAEKWVKTVVNWGQKTRNSLKIVWNTFKWAVQYWLWYEEQAQKTAERIMEIWQQKPVFDDTQIKSRDQIVADMEIRMGKLWENVMETSAEIEWRLMTWPKNYFEDLNAVIWKLKEWTDEVSNSTGWASKKQEDLKKQIKEQAEILDNQYATALENSKDRLESMDDKVKKLFDKANDYLKDNTEKIKDLEKELKNTEEYLKDISELMNDTLSDMNDTALEYDQTLRKYSLKWWDRSLERAKELLEWMSFQDLMDLWYQDIDEYMWYDVDDLLELKKARMNVQAQQTEYAKQGLDYGEEMKKAFSEKYETADITGIVEEAEQKLKEIVEKYGGKVDESLSLFENLTKAQSDLETKKTELSTQITDLQTKNATILQIIDDFMKKQIEDAEQLYQEARDTGELKIQYENQYQEELDITREKLVQNASKVHQMMIDMQKTLEARREMQSSSHSDYGWGRAEWWNVYSWKTYLVWEKWPELFVPKTSGSIVPNNEITNNNWITVNLNWMTVRSEADINLITDEIIRKIKLEKNFWVA